jgi:hypothetical protein
VPAEPQPSWSHLLHAEADGSYRLEVIDEDGVTVPVARQVSQAQAERLLAKIARESHEARKPIAAVVRDPWFMASAVITTKRLRG